MSITYVSWKREPGGIAAASNVIDRKLVRFSWFSVQVAGSRVTGRRTGNIAKHRWTFCASRVGVEIYT